MTIDQIKARNRAAGFLFFDPNSMRFFRSIVSPTIYRGNGRILFITSEQFRSGSYTAPRLYTVREYNANTHHISTVGEFNVKTRSAAIAEATSLTREAWNGPGFAYFSIKGRGR